MARRSAQRSATSDSELIAMVRAGDVEAYGQLYERHVSIAMSVAWKNVDNSADAEDVVADAFQSALQGLVAGQGPKEFFRAYLLSAVTRLAHHANRKALRTAPTDIEKTFEQDVGSDDPVMHEFETETITRAYRALPERWQAVLWYLDVERMKPAALAPILGLSPNAVSALAFRAREGLRRAYLQAHLNDAERGDCTEFASQLGAYVRGGLTGKIEASLRNHLDGCPACTAALVELRDVRGTTRAVLLPLLTGIPLAAWTQASTKSATTGLLLKGSTTSTLAKPWFVLMASGIAAAVVIGGASDAPVLAQQSQIDPFIAATQQPEAHEMPARPAPTMAPSEPPATQLTPTQSAVPAPTKAPNPTAVPAPTKAPNPTAVPAPTKAPNPTALPAQNPIPKPVSAKVRGRAFSSAIHGDPRAQRVAVKFSVPRGQDLGQSVAEFSFSKHASIDLRTVNAPAGWSCNNSRTNPGGVTCRTDTLKGGTTTFRFVVTRNPWGHNNALLYTLQGLALRENLFAHGF
ncbi:sigma-70 family RNA polymerase sigma factor [Arthrobacter sp. Y-9]|uniref:sigma-70 family RNA polymerase sigma factor n=1 Tax=Arthrobacter sp. Y-9 TaxID=3039385 RepID=UPI00241F335C|nr:sigma-70 family RNA polymerase sigma factor [Arthrobacter sp. Y-9]WFR84310.1 sigma-70 family RNA polymerase sigma factor [Arthrobacter sp. Y-9]